MAIEPICNGNLNYVMLAMDDSGLHQGWIESSHLHWVIKKNTFEDTTRIKLQTKISNLNGISGINLLA
jgi:hypothetical protein